MFPQIGSMLFFILNRLLSYLLFRFSEIQLSFFRCYVIMQFMVSGWCVQVFLLCSVDK